MRNRAYSEHGRYHWKGPNMNDDDKRIIEVCLCALAANVPTDKRVPGTTERPCANCQRTVLCSPASVTMMIERRLMGVLVLCMDCFADDPLNLKALEAQ